VRVSAGGVYGLGSQVVWCPKYRRPVVTGPVKARCEAPVGAGAAGHGWRIAAREIMPDHVRLFVTAHSSGSPLRIANQFKGFTWRMLRRAFRRLRSRLPALWSRSYLAATAGAVPAAMVQRCIGTQVERPWRKERAR